MISIICLVASSKLTPKQVYNIYEHLGKFCTSRPNMLTCRVARKSMPFCASTTSGYLQKHIRPDVCICWGCSVDEGSARFFCLSFFLHVELPGHILHSHTSWYRSLIRRNTNAYSPLPLSFVLSHSSALIFFKLCLRQQWVLVPSMILMVTCNRGYCVLLIFIQRVAWVVPSLILVCFAEIFRSNVALITVSKSLISTDVYSLWILYMLRTTGWWRLST